MNRILALQTLDLSFDVIVAHCGSNISCHYQSCSYQC